MNSICFSARSLLDMVERLHLMGGQPLFLDEVHKYDNRSTEHKEIIDLYPDMEITYSGSSLLQILNADTDLSRSSLSYDIPGMSFSEYLMFYHRIKLPKYSPEDLLNNTADVNPRGNQENESNILNNVLMLEYN